MSENLQSRREALVLGAGVAALAATPAMAQAPIHTGAPADFDFLVGSWKVAHRRLKSRLTGGAEWEEFAGTCVNWPTMGGQGNVDDNVIELPSGTYKAVGVRNYDATTRQWSIWWLDGRSGQIDVPVQGGFRNGVGVFVSDDTHQGKPVKVRFQWSKITPTTAQWDQAFSPDGGETWETNWVMQFTRA